VLAAPQSAEAIRWAAFAAKEKFGPLASRRQFLHTVTGVPANYIAKWNGIAWSPLGLGMNGPVQALAVSGNDLFAGGGFTTAGGGSANRIAKWNGTNWSTLGSGMNQFGYVRALTVSGNDLFAGGHFTRAGGKASAYLARARFDRPTLSILPSGSDVTVSWPALFSRFALQENPDVTNSNTWSNANHPLTTNGATKSATVPIASGNQFFRLTENY
jgi:hypothetical protein